MVETQETVVMHEFYRRLSVLVRRQKDKQRQIAELRGEVWVDPDDLEVQSAFEAAAQKARGLPDTAPVAGGVGELATEAEFDAMITAAKDTPVLIKFFAPWCRKCAALKPKYANLARAYGDRVIFIKLDVENKEVKKLIKERAGVNSIPTFQLWKSGKLEEQYVAGNSIPAVPKKLTELIDKHLSCGFSLTEQVEITSLPAVGEGSSTKPAPPGDEAAAATAAAAAAAAAEAAERRPLISQDAMAKFRAAQAAQSMNVARNPFTKG